MRLAQIHFQDAARPYLCVHLRLEEALGPASGGFGGIHRQIRVLQDLIEIGAVLRRQRDADAGVGGDLVAETFVGRADRFEDPRHEVGDVGVGLDRGLDDGEFVAAEPGDEVGCPDARPRLTATDFSNSSPIRCPSESLTLLNSSMSM